jgi:hypothetical protein
VGLRRRVLRYSDGGGELMAEVMQHGASVTAKQREPGFTAGSRNALAKHTGRTGEPCSRCGRKLRADEPVVVRGWSRRAIINTYSDGTRGLGSRIKDYGARCVECAGLRRVRERIWVLVFEILGREVRGSYYREEPCDGCGRPTIRGLEHGNRKHTFCSQPCETAHYNHRKRKPKEQKVCEVCGEEFTAKRVDTKTCSPACKQKAYRQRVKGVCSEQGRPQT